MVQRRFRPKKNRTTEFSEVPGLVKLWVLRLLAPLGGHREFVKNDGFQNDALARFLGLSEWLDGDGYDIDRRSALAALRKMHQQCEHDTPRQANGSTYLTANITKLSELAGLSETDRRILQFTVFIHSEQLLEDAADYLGALSSGKLQQVLAQLLDAPEHDIRTALSADGLLATSGLVKVDRQGTGMLRHKLDLLSTGFADAMLYSDAEPVSLLRDIVVPSKPTRLALEDFEHIRQSLAILLPYLRHALAEQRPGVNILLYGVPGTGKSELSRLMAKELACELFEVAGEDHDGDPLTGDRRMRAFSAAQRFLSRRRVLILFDEVEDVFGQRSSPFGFFTAPAPSRKAWINQMLEGNTIPALWVTNSVELLDHAFIRRFDLVIEMPIPPQRQRERIVRSAGADMLPEAAIRRIACADHLAPAVITRAVSVVKCIQDELKGKDIPATVEHLIGNTLAAQGHRPLKPEEAQRAAGAYDPAFINADADLVKVAKGLARTRSGRLCLSGPPGSGKTGFGQWLAEKLEVPLCVKTASDLISSYVGGTEQNIAEAFRGAGQQGALLLIDEVDSFLQDRRRAQRTWEVTGVNEMLTRMESFAGVFIATTNMMPLIDQAALRRFDLCVTFDYLSPEQAWRLLQRHCKALGLSAPGRHLKAAIANLRILTPGDFAAVVRQTRFNTVRTPAAFIEALEQHCRLKDDSDRKAIGFF
jgi:transitional endoplasmic reticulum ATPase